MPWRRRRTSACPNEMDKNIATREDRDALGAELRAEFAALRREIKISQRIGIGLVIEFVVLATHILVNGV